MSKFKVWIENPTSQIKSSDAFSNDSQRISGFMPNTTIDSVIVNTVLRQSSLVIAAMMNVCDAKNSLSVTSTVAEVQSNLRKTLALILNTAIETNVDGLNYSHTQIEAMAASETELGKLSFSLFNRYPIVGDKFIAILKTNDKYVYSVQAQVTRLDENLSPYFKLTESVLMHSGEKYLKQLYRHNYTNDGTYTHVSLLTTRSTAYTSVKDIYDDFNDMNILVAFDATCASRAISCQYNNVEGWIKFEGKTLGAACTTLRLNSIEEL